VGTAVAAFTEHTAVTLAETVKDLPGTTIVTHLLFREAPVGGHDQSGLRIS
jgi:hypothetical protein